MRVTLWVAQISRALRLLQSGDFLVKKHHWRFSDFNPYSLRNLPNRNSVLGVKQFTHAPRYKLHAHTRTAHLTETFEISSPLLVEVRSSGVSRWSC